MHNNIKSTRGEKKLYLVEREKNEQIVLYSVGTEPVSNFTKAEKTKHRKKNNKITKIRMKKTEIVNAL